MSTAHPCAACGRTCPPLAGPGRPRKWCSDECRPKGIRVGQRTGPSCADCGRPMWRNKFTLPEGQARCRPCRRESSNLKASIKKRPNLCIDCRQPSWGQRCKPCVIAAGICAPPLIRALDDHRVLRRQREQAAPGLSAHGRTQLLHMWKRQGKACAYCQRRATTVDHVVPLVRGGTNYEGNLAPACRGCNSSKGGLTLIEWRSGRRLPPIATSNSGAPLAA